MTAPQEILAQTPPAFDGAALLRDRAALLDGWSEIYELAPAPAAHGSRATRVARAAWYGRLITSLPVGTTLDALPRSTFETGPVDSGGDGAPWADLAHLVEFAFEGMGLGRPHPHPLDRTSRQSLTAAVDLLGEAFPRVAAGVLPFVSVGIVVQNPVPSMYLSQTPEVIYVGHHMLERDTWELADAILHESLHDVTELARQVRHVLVPSYTEDTSATTLLPWSVKQPTKRYFSTWRLLSACHVYVHLAGFRRSVIGPSAQQVEVPTVRARFMLDQLLASPHQDNLGEDGRVLVEWLDSSLKAMREVRA
ncbi:hypothetical protein ACFYNL_35895 [Streptomyces sp. NPDC007808]|uniref:hypothetical protein n=1 Tax=Streptomyces sp. NPDC007808 TaxID=3364779 RepID=UPI0036B67784